MSTDIFTVMWKDLKEILLQGGGRERVGLLRYGCVSGFFFPYKQELPGYNNRCYWSIGYGSLYSWSVQSLPILLPVSVSDIL